MKKFLIFLVAIVVVVSFGLTIFYFVRNDEVINFKTKEIYCNSGDIITRDELGLTVKKRNKKTTYNYNAGGEEVTSLVKYDTKHGYYVVSEDAKGGDVTLKIKTSNKKARNFQIVVHIGDGKEQTPYYISDVDDLNKMNDLLTKGDGNGNYYRLLNDITLTSAFTPIGAEKGENFIGNFDGNGHKISGINVAGTTYTNAGLFATMRKATVENLTLENVTISGNFATAGALAGSMEDSSVDLVAVKNAKISANGTVGGLVGVAKASADEYDCTITRCYVENGSLKSDVVLGGLVGELDRANVKVSYAKTTLNSDNGLVGGFVGKFKISEKSGTIQQSYAFNQYEGSTSRLGSFIGEMAASQTSFTPARVTIKNLYLVGNYTLTGKTVLYSNTANLGSDFAEYETSNKIKQLDEQTFKKSDTKFTFYQIPEAPTAVYWDGENTWVFGGQTTPTLRMLKRPLPTINPEFSRVTGTEVTVENESSLQDALENGIQEGSKVILKGTEYNLAGFTAEPKDLKDVTFVGNNVKIKNLTLNGSLFSKVDNCSIKDIEFVDLKFSTEDTAKDAVGLFGEVMSSAKYTSTIISNVKVGYANEDIVEVASNFGGVAASVKNNSTISECVVSGLKVDNTNECANLAGVVAIVDEGTIDNCTISVELSSANVVAGVVAQNNNGHITNNQITAKIRTENALYVGGIVGANNSFVDGNTANVTITVVASTKDGAKLGGAAAQNLDRGEITNTKLEGEGIVFNLANKALETFNSTVYVGGVAAENTGSISQAYNLMATVGNYTDETERDSIEGKNFYVGGVAYVNSSKGKISQVVVTSNIAGNTAAGAIVNQYGSADQVLVGFNNTTGKRNTIEGDVFVAGVAYEVGATGRVTNIQTRSLIKGRTDKTISSLVVLNFPNGAVVANGSINNAADGLGTLYKETYSDLNGSTDAYNLLTMSNASGSFTSVVINTSNIEGTLKVKQSFFNWGLWGNDYESSGNKNFFNYVGDDAFTNSDTFSGKTSITADGTNCSVNGENKFARLGRKPNYTYDLTFGSEWTIENGASLAFLQGAYAE